MAEQSFNSKLDSSLQTQIISMINNVIDELDTSYSTNKSMFDSFEHDDVNTTSNLTTISYDNNNNYNRIFYNKHSYQNIDTQCSMQHINFPSHLFGVVFSLEDKVFSEYESDLAREGGFTEELFIKYKPYWLSLLKNQHTSRLSQIYLENTGSHIIHKIFKFVLMFIPQLLKGIYSNYFCLKLYYMLTPVDQIHFLQAISINFVDLCINKISTYPIQYVIESCKNSLHHQEMIINAIQQERLMELCINIYGTHVIEKILSNFDISLTLYIIDFALEHFVYLSNNSNGVCVIKKIIYLFSLSNNRIFASVIKYINENAITLITNPYGNHVLQSIIEIFDINNLKCVFGLIKEKMIALSIQKYSSNVIEKCIQKSENFLNEFINEVIRNGFRSLVILIKNNYGNYVLQTVLRCCKEEEKKKILLNEIRIIVMNINDKKINSKWKNIL